MGAADSKFNVSQRARDEITTVKDRVEEVDPSLEKLKALKIAPPILKSPPTESTLTDILIRKSSSTSESGAFSPKIANELFSLYREWQEMTAKRISEGQEELENKIEIADALATKLLQRFNYSVSVMKTSATCFEDVYPLQVEVGELKGKLKEVLANYDSLCRRISAEGPDVLKASVIPFSSSELQQSGNLGRTAVQKSQ